VPLSVLAELLELGADAGVKDTAGRTPADLLRERLPELKQGRDMGELAIAVLAEAPPAALGATRAHVGGRPITLALRRSVEFGLAAAFPLLPLAGLLRAVSVCRTWRGWVLQTLHNLRRVSPPLVFRSCAAAAWALLARSGICRCSWGRNRGWGPAACGCGAPKAPAWKEMRPGFSYRAPRLISMCRTARRIRCAASPVAC